jgi:DNA-directed RNA polymerase subunit RPC12/RpoP
MSLSFSCPACGKTFRVDESLAGKRARCKACGGVVRIPTAPRPVDGSIDDPYGLDEARSPAPSIWPITVDEESLVPRRRSATGGKRRRARSGSRPWGVGLRSAGGLCLLAGLSFAPVQATVPALRGTLPTTGLGLVSGLASCVGMVLTIISVLGAIVSFASGNGQAFDGDSPGGQVGWGFSCLWTVVLGGVFAWGVSNGLRNRAPSLAAAQAGAPAGFPGPPAPFPQPGQPGPAFGRGSEVRSDLKVALSDGRFMRNTSMIGTAQPGVEISIDYNIESGSLTGAERVSLIIKSSKGRGELDNLHELRLRPSGTIRASSFLATPQEGPYEAWMEVSSMPGPFGKSKRVSNTIALQFTDVPVRDPAAEARAAMEEQQRRMMPGGPMGPAGPGMPGAMPRPGGPRFPGYPR